ncbi:MAG: M20/M25/M40 family metallo-hydrolase [Anaerolineae bacterium]
MSIKDLLTELSQASGPSGHEAPVRRIVRRELEKYADEVTTTPLGSVIGVKRAAAPAPPSGGGRKTQSKAPPAHKVLIEGHIDEIGLIVTAIDQHVIRFDEIGGYDPRILLSQNVMVHGREPLPGVIGARPPHVLAARDRDRPVPLSELFIDVGLPEARLRELVQVGDVITLDAKVVSLRNGMVAGKAFDDRASVVTVLDALRRLEGVRLAWDLYVVANVQEEDGAWFPGAFTSTYRIHPDVAVALDVSHGDQPGVGDVNTVPLDKGPGIARGPNVHPRVHERLVAAARAIEIPHRVTTYGGATGTNAWAMQVVAEGIPTGLLDLPLRYMHTPVETLALSDLERTARLLAAFVSGLDESFYQDLFGQGAVQTGRVKRPARKK